MRRTWKEEEKIVCLVWFFDISTIIGFVGSNPVLTLTLDI